MTEDKELLKKNIVTMIKIDSMIHYEDMEEVKKIRDTIIEQKMFSTSIGQKYIKKLEQILEGSNNFSCMFCGSEIVNQKLICNGCLSKIHLKKVQPEQESLEQENSQQESLEQVQNEQEYADNFNQEAVVLKEKIEETEDIKEKEEVKEIKAADIKKTFIFKDFWKGLSKTVQIVAVAVLLICIITIVGVCRNKPDSSESNYRMEISSVDEALSVLKCLFPSKEYNLEFQQQLYPAKEMFEVEIGEACGESWANQEKIDAYFFTIQSIEDPHYSCMCYVSIDGRVIGYGNLIYEADTSAFFRLR